MKKVISLLLVCLIVCFCGCKDKNENAVLDSQTDVTIIDTVSESAESVTQNTANENSEIAQNDNGGGNNSGGANKSSKKTNTVTSSSEFIKISASKPITDGGTVSITVSTSGVAALGEIYGMQYSIKFLGMTLTSISKGSMPSGWNCSITDLGTASSAHSAVVLMDCDFSTPLDDRQTATFTFESNGNGAYFEVYKNFLVQGKSVDTKIQGSNIILN